MPKKYDDDVINFRYLLFWVDELGLTELKRETLEVFLVAESQLAEQREVWITLKQARHAKITPKHARHAKITLKHEARHAK